MDLKERVYSVLIVSSAEKLNTAISPLLPELHYHPVRIVSDVNAAKRTCSERSYDFIIVNSPLANDTGVRFAIDNAGLKGAVVLLLVRAEQYSGVYDKATVHGVFTLSKPLSRANLSLALSWMESARELLRKNEEKSISVEAKMEEIRLVNRAKWLLISELKMEEPQAHRYIEKQAMDRCISKKEVATEIIRSYS